jgi:serine/threonine protein kinase
MHVYYVQANIHQRLLNHPNIITLCQTLETDLYLLLVLKFVSGKDLFYFLEQARNHYKPVLHALSDFTHHRLHNALLMINPSQPVPAPTQQ